MQILPLPWDRPRGNTEEPVDNESSNKTQLFLNIRVQWVIEEFRCQQCPNRKREDLIQLGPLAGEHLAGASISRKKSKLS